MAIVFLALGSNMNDRMAYISQAEAMLQSHQSINILQASKVYETEPWPKENQEPDHPHGEGGQKWYLNQVLKIESELSPTELAKVVSDLEKEMGRTKTQHWGSREIDIDILLYEDLIIDSPELEVPHRHMRDRQFVLVPLVEIAPDITDPVTGNTFTDILSTVKKIDDHKITPFL